MSNYHKMNLSMVIGRVIESYVYLPSTKMDGQRIIMGQRLGKRELANLQ